MSLTLELYDYSGRVFIWNNFVRHHIGDNIPVVGSLCAALSVYDVQIQHRVGLYNSLTFKNEEDKLEFVLIWS